VTEQIAPYFWLCLSAFAAGVVNAVAGGGTLLTFPALLAMLGPLGAAEASVFANATSTVALVPGSLAGAWAYRRQMEQARQWLIYLVGPSLVGGAIGSLLVTRLPAKVFESLVPWLLLAAAVLFLIDPLLRRKAKSATAKGEPGALATGATPIEPRVTPVADAPGSPNTTPRDVRSAWSVLGLVIFQLGVGIYGGYFGAGIGILMLSSLALMGVRDIHEMNALKTVLAAFINGIAVAIFVVDQKVVWHYALPMAVAAFVGGYLGAHFALRIDRRIVRGLVIVIGFGLAIYYFLRP